MSADSPRHSSSCTSGGMVAVPITVPPQVVSDRSILDSAIGFINEVTLAHTPPIDPKDTITWARFETSADISDPRFGEDWELEGNVSPPLLLILGYGLGVQVWAIPANGEAVEVLSWRHGIVSALRILPTPLSTADVEENGRADEPIDAFGDKRPLIALVDGSSTSGSQPQFCAINFVSLKTGSQVKTIKFKNPVIDILANRSSVAVTFHERIAVFDARTLEDRLSISTCYPSPGINPNPAALGSRWLAYAENKLLHSKHSGGGCDGDGVASYTATVLNASKSLVKGLRELGEHVAAGLTGTSGSASNSRNTSFDSGCGLETKQSGIVTIIDIKNPVGNYSSKSGVPTSSTQAAGTDTIIAHFIAHSEALVAMEFDYSGMLLVTADRRGHDFHVFRIQPNPVGSSLAAVHHLYILHRGDTSAKVQNITLSLDTRWVAVSTLRGTTHVFPITPYGGTMGVRTHTSLHVVNKLSRFHRSAGLSGDGRSNSPITHSESATFTQSLHPYHNSTLPPFPRPTVVTPLAQLRQPFAIGTPPSSATLSGVKSVAGGPGSGSQRQRLSSLSDDSGKPLSVCAIFAKSRSWLLDPPNVSREAPHRMQRKAVDSLFVMAGHGALIQYDLDTKLASNVAKEKICDDTPIELEVEAKAQWNLGRRKEGSQEIMPPLSADNWLIKNRNSCMLTDSTRQYDDPEDRSESWLAQVEIITHAGPHRRLWMGPQFVFKTYNTPSGSNLSHVDIEAVEIGTSKSSASSTSECIDPSNPLNMPLNAAGRSSAVPVLIESGSYSSIEHSPKLMNRFRHDHLHSDFSVAHGDSRLKEDLADAMRESPSAATSSKDSGGHGCESAGSSDNIAFYDALTIEDDQENIHSGSASAAALASVLPNIHSYDNSSSYESLDSIKKPKSSIEKIVNPLGTVTTVTSCLTTDVKTDILDEVVSQLAAQDTIIHENCDESLFRPVVAIFCDEKTLLQNEQEARDYKERYQPPENISSKLVVPVIEKEINDELNKREKLKTTVFKSKSAVTKNDGKDQKNFEQLSLLNKKQKNNDLKDQRTCTLKDKHSISQTNKDNNCKQKDQTSKECLPSENVCEKKTGDSNNSYGLKEKSTEIKISQKVCKIEAPQEFSKNELNFQEKKVNAHSAQTDEQPAQVKGIRNNGSNKVTRPKIQQKVDARRQPQKKSEESELTKTEKQNISKEKKDSESASEKAISAQDIDGTTKDKVKPFNAMKERNADLKVTANTPPEKVQIEISKNQSDYDNLSNSLESGKSIEINTAKNEKAKETKNISKTNQSANTKEIKNIEDEETNKIKVKTTLKTADENTLQSSDHFVEDKTNQIALKTNSKSLQILNAPFEAKDKIQVSNASSGKGVKSNLSESLGNTTVQPELCQNKQNAFKVSNRDASNKDNTQVDSNKNDKNKEKVPGREERTTKNDYLQAKESTPSSPLNEMVTLVNDDNAASDALFSNTKKSKKLMSADSVIEKKEEKSNEPTRSDSIESVEKVCENDKRIKKSREGDKDKTKKIINNENTKKDSLETEHKCEEGKKENEINGGEKDKITKIINNQTPTTKIVTKRDSLETKSKAEERKQEKRNYEEQDKTKEIINNNQTTTTSKATKEDSLEAESTVKPAEIVSSKAIKLKLSEESVAGNQNKVETKDAESVLLNTANLQDPKDLEPSKVKRDKNKSTETKVKDSFTNELKNVNKDLQRKEFPDKSLESKSATSDNKNNASTSNSPQKKGKNFSKEDLKNEADLNKIPSASSKENVEAKEVSKECFVKKGIVKGENQQLKGSSSEKESLENTFDICGKSNKSLVSKIQNPQPQPPRSVWKTLSGAEMINKNHLKSESGSTTFPLLGTASKLNTPNKLLPEVPTPSDMGKRTSFDEFSILKSFDALPPLPALEPLQLLSSESKSNSLKDISLINFESPVQENPALQRKITPAPRGFTEQSLILALCGSLHYENEQSVTSSEKKDASPTLSSNQSSTALEEPSLADYKSLTENDDPYMSLEHSSQDTNTTTTTNTTNEKFSSSTNSSGSEEIVIMEEKKMTKKQKRKKQQHLNELQKQKEQQQQQQQEEMEIDDEELRPLIAMTESQVDQGVIGSDDTLPTISGNLNKKPPLAAQPSIHSTTTDSEGPMPATTSDDNVFAIPVPIVHNPHKIKTKKIEHKINLIAAIEAATSSSSTSSAEESGVELSGRSPHDNVEALISVSSSQQTTSNIPLPIVAMPPLAVGVLKKKTKRRRR